jgi:hypothetical protein
MSTLLTIQRWLGQQIVPLLFIGFAILMGIAMVYFSAQSRRSSLARDRSGRTEDTFAESLAAYGFDPEIARMTYLYLQQNQRIAFPILPIDDLERDLGLGSEDVDQTVRNLLNEAGREYLPGQLKSPLITVTDLVRFIQTSPRRDAIARRRRA